MPGEPEPGIELADLPREQVGPFLLLGLDKSATKEEVDAHWADRLKWARKQLIKVPLEDINWARETLNDVERRVRADAASLNVDTTAGTLRRLAEQTVGRVGPEDFIALPCSHPDCCAIAYFVRGDAGQRNSVVRLLGVERLRANLGLVGNRVAADEAALGAALLGMMSETTTISRPELLDYVATLCRSCDLGLGGFVKNAAAVLLGRGQPVEPISKRLKRFTVKSFMDAWTLNAERLQQCCVHVGSTDGAANPVRVPFCARQLFGDLRRKTSAGQVPINFVLPAGRLTRARS
jgi:hypothetical protein